MIFLYNLISIMNYYFTEKLKPTNEEKEVIHMRFSDPEKFDKLVQYVITTNCYNVKEDNYYIISMGTIALFYDQIKKKAFNSKNGYPVFLLKSLIQDDKHSKFFCDLVHKNIDFYQGLIKKLCFRTPEEKNIYINETKVYLLTTDYAFQFLEFSKKVLNNEIEIFLEQTNKTHKEEKVDEMIVDNPQKFLFLKILVCFLGFSKSKDGKEFVSYDSMSAIQEHVDEDFNKEGDCVVLIYPMYTEFSIRVKNFKEKNKETTQTLVQLIVSELPPHRQYKEHGKTFSLVTFEDIFNKKKELLQIELDQKINQCMPFLQKKLVSIQGSESVVDEIYKVSSVQTINSDSSLMKDYEKNHPQEFKEIMDRCIKEDTKQMMEHGTLRGATVGEHFLMPGFISETKLKTIKELIEKEKAEAKKD